MTLISAIHILSVGIHLATYSAAAVYSHLTETHRDFCPIYISAAVATVLHLAVVCATELRHLKRIP